MAKKSCGKVQARKKVGHDEEDVEKYDMELSRQRLSQHGFNPAITKLSPDAVVETWFNMVQRYLRRQREDTPKFERQTRGMLFLRNGSTCSPSLDQTTLEGMLSYPDIGSLVLQHIFMQGYITVLQLAMASKKTWHAVYSGLDYWNFFAGRLQNVASAGIFVSASPDYTIHEMNVSRLIDPHGLGVVGPSEDWHTSAVSRELDVIDRITMIRRRSGPIPSVEPDLVSNKCSKSEALAEDAPPPPKNIARVFDASVIQAARSINNVDEIWRANQFATSHPTSIFEPQLIYCATHLQLLLLQIFERRNALKILYFHKAPFLDRRILSIILQACPQVVMIGIYDCPLLHFGDVICLLDLIHEVNRQRRREKTRPIESLEFYPHSKGAAPSGSAGAASVTSDPVDLDILQRGFYAILLKSYTKAKKLNIKLLFAEGKAFRAFLFQVPNPPLSVLCFLDASERHIDIKSSNRNAINEQKKATYDILKSVRLGLEHDLHLDWPGWYSTSMGDYLVFCSSCGYEMLQEFFPAGSRQMHPQRRICAACTLQFLLDKEPHGMRQEKLTALSKLLPTWKPEYFNKDAPLCPGLDGIIKLKSTESKRPHVNTLQVSANGTIAARSYMEALVRDNKFQFDSVQGLPSLEELVAGETQNRLWQALFHHCHGQDIYSRAKRRCRDEKAEGSGGATAPEEGLSVSGTPVAGPIEEIWTRRQKGRETPAYTHVSAAKFFKALAHKGW